MTKLAQTILAEIAAKPQHFHDIVNAHMDVSWRDLLKAWGELRAANVLGRDDYGNYIIAKKA